MNQDNDILNKEKRCGYCFEKTDGTQYSIDDDGNKLYFCSPLHHMMYFHDDNIPDIDMLK